MRFMATDVAMAIGGQLVGQNAHLDGVSFDSRSLKPGQLFVPIVAERDGHDFISAALAAGAGAYLTSREPDGRTAIVVPDTLQALIQLGAWARQKLDAQLAARVTGVTGSVGKTTTKDFIAAALGSQLRVSANLRSFNNDQGLPTTILNSPDDVEALIVEMGMRGPGEIARLCAVAKPNIGVVTSVAEAHTQFVGSLDQVASAKAELVQSLGKNGFAILNADDERVAAMRATTSATVLTYGRAINADVRIETCLLDSSARATVQIKSPWGDCEYKLDVPGMHMALNAAAAIAVAGVIGVDIQTAARALTGATVSPMRMQLRALPGGGTLLDDTYNANPFSMRAALDTLAALKCDRRVAVVGLMAELADPESQHVQIVDYARELKIELISVGTDLYGAVPVAIEVASDVLRSLGANDAALVKASRAAQLERVVVLALGG